MKRRFSLQEPENADSMLVYFGKKILTAECSPVKNLMLQFGHGNDMRLHKVQINKHFCMYEVCTCHFL